MGSEASSKTVAKQLRRAIGPEATALIRTMEVRVSAHAAILRRGFFGRLKWLVFGR